MQISAVISDKIFCVHAGIPGSVTLAEITKDDAYPYVWNDPSEETGIGKFPRGLGMRTFGEDVFEEFLQVNGLEQMVRGHSVVEGGFKWWFGERLLSIDDAVGVVDGDEGLRVRMMVMGVGICLLLLVEPQRMILINMLQKIKHIFI